MSGRGALRSELADGDVRLVPLAACHVEGLRAACAQDAEIWQIYPESLIGEHFDPVIERRMTGPDWISFAALLGGDVVGLTGYIRADDVPCGLEIGGTYIAPRLRGSGFNGRMKRLMIDHAFACGYRRIEFRVDERNLRSQAAVLKLGALREGMVRHDRITWTGHLRNTCIFGLLPEDWLNKDQPV